MAPSCIYIKNVNTIGLKSFKIINIFQKFPNDSKLFRIIQKHSKFIIYLTKLEMSGETLEVRSNKKRKKRRKRREREKREIERKREKRRGNEREKRKKKEK